MRSYLSIFLLCFIISPSVSYCLELDSSCLKYFPKLKREQLEANLKHNLRLASLAITDCQFRYPELEPYLTEWRNNSIDLRVKCADFDKEKGLAATTLTTLRPLYSPPVVTLFSNDIKTLLSKKFMNYKDHAVHALVHEIFHSTHANNAGNAEHKETHTITPSYEKEGCDASDVTTDRVETLTSICDQRKTIAKKTLPAEIEIFKKIQKCRMKKGCTNLFTSEVEFGAGYFVVKSSGLSEDQAIQACRRINVRGACEAFNIGHFKNEELKNYIDSNTTLVDLRGEISPYFFKNENVPLSSIEKFPNLKLGLQSLKKSYCFEERFKITDNQVVCKTSSDAFSSCKAPQNKHSRCDEKTRNAVSEWQAAVDLKVFGDLHLVENFVQNESPTPIKANLLKKAFENPVVQEQIGKEKIKRIKNILSQNYPGYSRINCGNFDQENLKQLVARLNGIKDEIKQESPQACEVSAR